MLQVGADTLRQVRFNVASRDLRSKHAGKQDKSLLKLDFVHRV